MACHITHLQDKNDVVDSCKNSEFPKQTDKTLWNFVDFYVSSCMLNEYFQVATQGLLWET